MTFDATHLGVPAAMASAAAQPAAGDTFDIRAHGWYLFWGLFTSSEPNLERALEGQVAGARAVQDLRIHVYRRWTDLLITVISAGIVTPVSVRFEGVLAPASP